MQEKILPAEVFSHDGKTVSTPRETQPANDVDDRKRIETELRESETFLQTIIETEPECVKLVASDGTLIMMNRAGLDMIQVDSLDKVKGKSIYPLILPEYREAFKALTEGVFQGTPGTMTFEMSGIKGRRLWLETHAVPLRNDAGEVVAVLGITRDVTERRKAEAELLQEKKFSDAIIDSMPGTFTICDEQGALIRWNKNVLDVTGYSGDELSRMNMRGLFLEDRDLMVRKIQEVFDAGKSSVEARILTKSGARIPFLITGLRMAMHEKQYCVWAGIDLSERKQLEDQLRQSQKMESIGTLAGGIAHDFNNVLTAVIGYGNLVQKHIRKEDPISLYVEQIITAANRAASLTRGLLAYSRKQVLNPQRVDLNDIVRQVERLLARFIGEDVELKSVLTDREATVLADTGQIEQVLINLATNARDAMPGGGSLFIETELVELDPDASRTRGLREPGTYALLTVTDSGMGMDAATRERIFEPFFTTKESGKGTGLGLAIVYGTIRQHHGAIEVESEIGRGTAFKIYLPAVRQQREEAASDALPSVKGGTETVLVAEDDEIVRTLTASVLTQYGYSVIKAEDGEAAVNKFMENRDKVRLLVLDVIMPKKNGKEVYEKISIFTPGVKALFLSGYDADSIHEKGLLDAGLDFLIKPVAMNDLLRTVREILDR